MNVNIATQEDLQILKKELVKEISELLQQSTFSWQSREWLKTWEVMKMFNISKGKLQAMRNNGTIAFSKIGKCIYFKQEDFEKLFDQNSVKHSPGPGRGYNRYSIKKAAATAKQSLAS